MKDFFNHDEFVERITNELNLSYKDIQRIHKKHEGYATQVYAIPITVYTEPKPYQQPRVNPRTRHIYVPDKQKMTKHIRNLILDCIGPDGFLNGFFPIYNECIIHSSLYLPMPSSFSREKKYLAESKILRPIVTPDNDNVEKIINDAIKSFIIYDDAQIVSNITEKYWSMWPRMEFVIFYNAMPNSVHVNTMNQRKERWEEMLKNPKDKPLPVIQHLSRYFNS